MAHVISDGLEGEVGIHEMLHAGMPKSMGTGSVNADAGLMQIVRNTAGNSTIRIRSQRGKEPEEDMSIGCLRADPQIIEDGFTNYR